MSYRPQSDDTAIDAERVMFEIYARMTPAEKLERVRELCRHANRLALEGLRARHPTETDDELHDRLITIRLGDELAARWRRARDG